MAPELRLILDALCIVVAVALSWAAMRHKAADALREAEAARSSATALHRRVDDHERRLTTVETTQALHGRRLEERLAAIDRALDRLQEKLEQLLAAR